MVGFCENVCWVCEIGVGVVGLSRLDHRERQVIKEIGGSIGWARDEIVGFVLMQVLHVELDVQARLDNAMQLNVRHSNSDTRHRRRQGIQVKKVIGRAQRSGRR
jgi:hypothetical protein